MEIVQLAAHAVGQTQGHLMQLITQSCLNFLKKGVHTHAPFCRDMNHIFSHGQVLSGAEICLIVAFQHRGSLFGELFNQSVHHRNMLLPVGICRINHMEQKICILQFFQSGMEGINQMVGKLCNKAHGIA